MSPRALPPGTTLGPYQVVSLLGQGPFGLTYQATDPASGAMVAIKEYLPAAYALRNPDHSVSPISELEESDYEFGMERFRADARALQHIQHPSLAAVRDVFDANGTVHMVMSYEDGPSLAEALNREPTLTEWALLKIAVSLIDACKTLHGAGLIHRDVKEAHVKLRPDGTPVLLDFGAARVGLLRRRLAIGTGSPELDPTKLDGSAGPWTDIHALAAMLFRVAKRLGATCSPRVVDAMRRGISVQPDDVAPVTAQWSEQIDALLREAPAPELPVGPVQPEETNAGPAAAAPAEVRGAYPATVDTETDSVDVEVHVVQSAEMAPRREDEVASDPPDPPVQSLQAVSLAHAESAEALSGRSDGASSFDRNEAEALGDMAESDVLSEPPRAEVALAIVGSRQPEGAPPSATPSPQQIEGASSASASDSQDAPGAVSVRLPDPRPQACTKPMTPAGSAESEAALELDRLTRWVAAAAIVAIVFGVVMWRLDSRTPVPSTAVVRPSPPTPPVVDVPAPVARTAPEAVAAATPLPPSFEQPDVRGTPLPEVPAPPPAVAISPPPPDASMKAEIEVLLAAAARDVAGLRLTTPRGSNAVEKYETVLALDPGNDAARQGLGAVSDRYVDLAGTALARGQLATARRYLELAQSIAPDNARVQTLRRELEARQQQSPRRSAEETVAAEWHSGLYDRVQDFLESNQARPPRPPSRAEQIPDRLGGQR
ncbi:MAG: hypothetical protein HONDAALG_01414 [Gammaproteobacteria bacterium]|nr:hypothetical protein [Gammaproteobacteria bacterium]